jgi:hypothetical protein
VRVSKHEAVSSFETRPSAAPQDEVEGGKAPLTYVWKFGDGTPDSTEANPKHTYTKPGTFRADLEDFHHRNEGRFVRQGIDHHHELVRVGQRDP